MKKNNWKTIEKFIIDFTCLKFTNFSRESVNYKYYPLWLVGVGDSELEKRLNIK